MIAVLERLKAQQGTCAAAGKMAVFGISGGRRVERLFMTYPPLDAHMPCSGSTTGKRTSWRCLEFVPFP